MPNTPTESEFDKELDKRFHEYLGGTPDDDELEDWREFKAAIKQAVDKHVIGEDNLICETYPEKNGTYCNKCKHCRVRNNDEFINGYEYKAEMSRKALYGGDKK